MELKNSKNPITWIVFLVTLSVVLLSLVSVVFPALILSNSQNVTELEQIGVPNAGPQPFEVGIWAGPLIASNITIFLLYLLYKKEKLPSFLTKIFSKVFQFEISRKASFVVIIVLLGIYVAASANELSTEEKWGDYQYNIKDKVENRSLSEAFSSFDVPLKFFFLSASIELFGNIRVIPFIASIALLIATYFVTVKLSNKRFAGIVSLVILMQSNLFLTYDTSATYENFWILFYIVSLYLMFKFWPLSPISYILSALGKPLTFVFLPMSIFFLLRASMKKRNKILVLVSYLVLILVSLALVASLGVNVSLREESMNSDEFWMGFTSFAYQLRGDGLVLMFLLPLVFGLFVAAKKNIVNAESIMILISGMLLVAPVLTGFTVETNQPYRFVPLVAFFAMGVGVLLSKRQA